MTIQETLTWLLPATLGVALKLTAEKDLRKERIFRALIQAGCIGYFANEICIIQGWLIWRSVVAGGAAFLAEYIIQFILKFRFEIIKMLVARWLGFTVPVKDDKAKE